MKLISSVDRVSAKEAVLSPVSGHYTHTYSFYDSQKKLVGFPCVHFYTRRNKMLITKESHFWLSIALELSKVFKSKGLYLTRF